MSVDRLYSGLSCKDFLARLRALLTRETAGGRFVPEVDGLRFFAIGGVLLFHIIGYVAVDISQRGTVMHSVPSGEIGFLRDWLYRFAQEGFVGVQLFFAISGLILGIPFARYHLANGSPVHLRQYFVRRLTRLEPPFVINLLISATLLVLVLDWSLADVLPHLVASVFYAHSFIYGAASTINPVIWSLEVEVQFYLLVPILTLLFAIRTPWQRRLAIFVLILSFAYLQQFLTYEDPTNPLRAHTLLHQLHWFLVGLMLADLHVTRWSGANPPGSSLYDLSALVAATLFFWSLQHREHLAGLGYVAHYLGPICILVIYSAAFRGRAVRFVLTRPALYIIGGMCYTIYLYHATIKSAIGRVTSPWVLSEAFTVHGAIQFVLIALAIITICIPLFILFEKPFMRADWWPSLIGRFRTAHGETVT